MKRQWVVIEKVISVFLVFTGVIAAQTIYATFHNLQWFPGEHLKLSVVLWNYFIFLILTLFAISGGILLLLGKKTGWILAVITMFLNAVVYFIPDSRDSINGHLWYEWWYQIFIVRSVIYFLGFFLLTRKPFLQKYNPSQKAWLIIWLVISFSVIDKLLKYLIHPAF